MVVVAWRKAPTGSVEDAWVEGIGDCDGKCGAFGGGSWDLKFDWSEVFAGTVDDVVGVP